MELKRTTYKTSPKEFKKNGFDYVLLASSYTYAIYQQMKDNDIYGYELHKIKRDKDNRIILPFNEEFGKKAWSFQYLDNLSKYCKENSLDI